MDNKNKLSIRSSIVIGLLIGTITVSFVSCVNLDVDNAELGLVYILIISGILLVVLIIFYMGKYLIRRKRKHKCKK